jgi:hypothetical protein
MKATAIGLIFLGAYWVVQGIEELRKDDMSGVLTIVLGIATLPLAKYLWGKDLGGTRTSR